MTRHNWYRDWGNKRFVCGRQKGIVDRFGECCYDCGAILGYARNYITQANPLTEEDRAILDERWSKSEYSGLISMVNESLNDPA